MQAGSQDNSFSYVLPSVLTIETAEQLAAEFKQWPLTQKSALALDVSQVETITTPGIQLIVSLEKTVVGEGGTFTLTGKRSEALVHALKDSGLDNLLGKMA